MIHYLDDFLFAVAKGDDGGSAAFKRVQAQVLQDIRSAGFSVSVPKLQLDPEQALVFLGWLVELAKNSLTASNDRVQDFLKTLQRLLLGSRKVHVRLLARITGQLQSMALALGPAARIYSRALYDLENSKPAHVWNWHVRIDDAAFADLQFWQKNCDIPSIHIATCKLFCRDLKSSQSCLIMMIHACGSVPFNDSACISQQLHHHPVGFEGSCSYYRHGSCSSTKALLGQCASMLMTQAQDTQTE